MTGPGHRPTKSTVNMVKFKTPAMETAYLSQLEGAQGSHFNGVIDYANKEEALKNVPLLDTICEVDLLWVGNIGLFTDNQVVADDLVFQRLWAMELLAKIVETKPQKAEFELENEDGEQFKLVLYGDTWALLERKGSLYHEVV